MGKHTLFCVFGPYKQNYRWVHIDGHCDYAFMTYYVNNQATFVDHSDPDVQIWLGKAASSNFTSFGIHVPLRQVLRVGMSLR
ncbi:hypothetical protein MRX96_003367 [Rhipicephalus microplus]